MSDEVPSGRCGFSLTPEDIRGKPSIPADDPEDWHKSIQAVSCWRKPWEESENERCIWHADVENKPIDALSLEHEVSDSRLDGAILRGIEGTDGFSLSGMVLRGADFSHTYLPDVDLSNCFLGDANFKEANLWASDLTNATLAGADLSDTKLSGVKFIEANLVETNLTNADLKVSMLTNANLIESDLTNADLRSADLTNADLRAANLTGVAISYSDLGDFQVNEGTTFGGRSQWEVDADSDALEAIPHLPWQLDVLGFVGRPFTNPDDLKQAELQYRATQRILRENDLRQLPELAIREKHARRKRALAERDYWTWLKLAFYRWPLGYGERVRNVLATSAVTIVGFALAYPFVGGMEASTGETTPYAFGNVTPAVAVPEWVEILGANLYFSAVTFSTLGYGDIQPASPAAQALASIESLLGALLMAFLVFVLGRRTTW